MAINLKFPLQYSSNGFATNDLTIDAVRDDIRLLLITNHGERPVHFDFGANLRSLIFEQGSVARKAEDLILSAIEKWMPFVKINNIVVTDSTLDSNLKEHEMHIKIDFEVGQIEGSLSHNIRN